MDETRARNWKSLRLSQDPAEFAASEGTDVTADPACESKSGTFIESGAVFEGTLKLKGDFRIDSEFHGELATDGVIVVGPSGSVEGNIQARQVEIEGAVVGNVTARRLFVLRASGHLHGDVESACIEIERHAFFQGGTRMTRPQATSASADTGAKGETKTEATEATAASTPSQGSKTGSIATA